MPKWIIINKDKMFNIIDFNKIVSSLINEKWSGVYSESNDVR